MALSHPYPIDKAFPNAVDLRRGYSAVFPREGLFPDPNGLLGVAYAGTGWAVGARPFSGVTKRGGVAFSQNYGAATFANDANVPAAWTLPGAPSSGSITSLLWIRATDPTQGEALTQIAGEVDPQGAPRPRAVPVFGITTGTTTVAPVLPAGAVLISTVTIASTSTSAATSVIVQSYGFANVLGGPVYYRNAAEMVADIGNLARGETAYCIDDQSTWKRLATGAGISGFRALHIPAFNRNYDAYYEQALQAAYTFPTITFPAMPVAYRIVATIAGTAGGNGGSGGTAGASFAASGSVTSATANFSSRSGRYRSAFTTGQFTSIARIVRFDVSPNSTFTLNLVAESSVSAEFSIAASFVLSLAGEF